MMVLDKKEMKFEELNSVAGGNAVGPVKETGPLGTGPIAYPYEQKTGPLMTPPNSCDPPFKTGPIGIRV